MHLKPLNKRVQIHRKGKEGIKGDLYELVGYHSVLPQYFAILDDGSERDLRNDNYSLMEAQQDG